MGNYMTPEGLARLWDSYVEAARRYEVAKERTDAAETERDVAARACDEAYQAWEAACDDEVRYGEVVRQIALEYEAASDGVFLSRCGIQPDTVIPG
jgi:hypothetical protein